MCSGIFLKSLDYHFFLKEDRKHVFKKREYTSKQNKAEQRGGEQRGGEKGERRRERRRPQVGPTGEEQEISQNGKGQRLAKLNQYPSNFLRTFRLV